MHEDSFISQLRHDIDATLSPIVGEKCVLLGVPYYLNIGDILIWEGTRQFIKQHRIDCIMHASKESFDFGPIESDVTILLQGGGNFGDLWEKEQIFRNKVIESYTRNKIVILPQSIFYQNRNKLVRDSELYAKHQDLHIFARDNQSYAILKECFNRNSIYVAPDMAFFVHRHFIKRYEQKETAKILFLLRNDSEQVAADYKRIMQSIHNDYETKDWPTLHNRKFSLIVSLFFRMRGYQKYLPSGFWDWYAEHLFRPYILKKGVRFLNPYKEVYTTRLHGAILSILLGKEVYMLDNSYGKISAFYETWLQDLDSAHLLK